MPLKNESNTYFQISLKKMKYYWKKNNIEYEKAETPAKLIAWWTANLSQRQTYNNIFNFSAWTPRSTDRKSENRKRKGLKPHNGIFMLYTYNVLFSQSNFLVVSIRNIRLNKAILFIIGERDAKNKNRMYGDLISICLKGRKPYNGNHTKRKPCNVKFDILHTFHSVWRK